MAEALFLRTIPKRFYSEVVKGVKLTTFALRF